MMHIGLLRRSALGDVILWSALVAQCLRRYPEVSISWMIDPAFIPLFNAPEFTQNDRLHWCPIPKPDSWQRYRQCLKTLRPLRFDVLLCAQASLRSNVLYPFISANRKIGFDKTRGRDGHGFFVNERIPYRDNHLLEGFAQFFEHAGYPLDLTALTWPIEPNAHNKATHENPTDERQKIGIVVAASKAERTWPLHHQKKFVFELLKTPDFRGKIILLGGNSTSEHAMANALTETCQQNLAQSENRLQNLVGKTPLAQLPQVISQLDCIIAPDTGPAHIARAVNVPVIGLYAVARSALSGPYGSPFTIDAYAEAAQKLLNTPADHLSWHARNHHEQAMDLIQPQTVLTQTLKALNFRSKANLL